MLLNLRQMQYRAQVISKIFTVSILTVKGNHYDVFILCYLKLELSLSLRNVYPLRGTRNKG